MKKQTAIKYAEYLNAYQGKQASAIRSCGMWCVCIHKGTNVYYASIASLKDSVEYKAARENAKALNA